MTLSNLSERDVQVVLLARAFEEADTEQRLAFRATSLDEGEPQAALARRARQLVGQLDAQLPFLESFRRLTRLGLGLGPWLFALAALVGAASSALGPERRVNLLSVPLLGLIAWNLLLYLLFALVWLLRGRFLPGQGLPRLLPGAVTFAYLRRLKARLAGVLPATTTAVVGRALASYLDGWRAVSRPLTEARARRLFHLGALGLAAGMVAGMYLRGLALEYRATWESTFLSPRAAETLLTAVLAPARALLAVEPPPLAALRAPADGEAAVWIHLLATTAALFIGLPRTALALIESARILRLARRLPLDLETPYFRRLLTRTPAAVVLQPYSFTPGADGADRVAAACRELFGDRTEVCSREPLAYGEERLPMLAAGTQLAILLFNLAQTPEAEVHGFVARSAAGQGRWRAIVDAGSYREQLGEGEPSRLDERRRLWLRTLRGAGLPVAVVDLRQADLDTLVAALSSPAGDEG